MAVRLKKSAVGNGSGKTMSEGLVLSADLSCQVPGAKAGNG
jgi:hypothetical protein